MTTVAPMAPAFRTRGRALAFSGVVAGLLALPAVLRAAHAPDHDHRLAAVPIAAGPYSYLQKQIYDETGDLDVVFAGDSLLWVGIDTSAVVDALGQRLDRQAHVVTLGWNFHGDDLTYYALRDLLERRRVNTVVLRLPAAEDAGADGNRPHPLTYHFLMACEHDPVQPTLPWPYHVVAYGIETIGAPRHLLTLLRPDLVERSPYESSFGSYLVELGPGHGPFRRIDVKQPEVTATRKRRTLGDSELLHVVHGPSGDYQRGYVEALRRLLDEHHVKVVFVRAPLESEARATSMDYDGLYADIFGKDTPVIAIRPADLFSGLDDETVHQLYYDGRHFNKNGATLFTATVMPVLLELALDAGTTH